MKSTICAAVMTFLLAATGLTQHAALAEDATPLRGTLTVPVAVEPTATSLDRTAGQQWHRVTLKLVGSLCPACLIALEDKLKKMPGVTFAKVTRPDAVEPGTPRPRNASLVLLYDSNAGKFDRLIELIKKELYRPTDVKDVEVDAGSK
jgi:hypothetical protein